MITTARQHSGRCSVLQTTDKLVVVVSLDSLTVVQVLVVDLVAAVLAALRPKQAASSACRATATIQDEEALGKSRVDGRIPACSVGIKATHSVVAGSVRTTAAQSSQGRITPPSDNRRVIFLEASEPKSRTFAPQQYSGVLFLSRASAASYDLAPPHIGAHSLHALKPRTVACAAS